VELLDRAEKDNVKTGEVVMGSKMKSLPSVGQQHYIGQRGGKTGCPILLNVKPVKKHGGRKRSGEKLTKLLSRQCTKKQENEETWNVGGGGLQG